MGNEFGHPEWIDFPREGNNWSYAHARRQWSLASNGFLRYSQLGEFDRAMIRLVKRNRVLQNGYPWKWNTDYDNKTLVFSHRNLLFVFNWHPEASIPDYITEVPRAGKYTIELTTDDPRFGGQGRNSVGAEHFSYSVKDENGNLHHYIKIYNTSRTAVVLKWHR
jgi:1,4-alpha-glucan branching enzyme